MRVAVFVDAGYLYAAGSDAHFGQTLPRSNLQLDVSAVIDKLKETACELTDGAKLLRIYWYDGALAGELSGEHRNIADTNDVKLRLGVVTPYGKQKGVDSLIVKWEKSEAETFLAQRGDSRDILTECVDKFVDEHSEELAELCRSRLGRRLDDPEKKYIRAEIKKRTDPSIRASASSRRSSATPEA